MKSKYFDNNLEKQKGFFDKKKSQPVTLEHSNPTNLKTNIFHNLQIQKQSQQTTAFQKAQQYMINRTQKSLSIEQKMIERQEKAMMYYQTALEWLKKQKQQKTLVFEKNLESKVMIKQIKNMERQMAKTYIKNKPKQRQVFLLEIQQKTLYADRDKNIPRKSLEMNTTWKIVRSTSHDNAKIISAIENAQNIQNQMSSKQSKNSKLKTTSTRARQKLLKQEDQQLNKIIESINKRNQSKKKKKMLEEGKKSGIMQSFLISGMKTQTLLSFQKKKKQMLRKQFQNMFLKNIKPKGQQWVQKKQKSAQNSKKDNTSKKMITSLRDQKKKQTSKKQSNRNYKFNLDNNDYIPQKGSQQVRKNIQIVQLPSKIQNNDLQINQGQKKNQKKMDVISKQFQEIVENKQQQKLEQHQTAHFKSQIFNSSIAQNYPYQTIQDTRPYDRDQIRKYIEQQQKYLQSIQQQNNQDKKRKIIYSQKNFENIVSDKLKEQDNQQGSPDYLTEQKLMQAKMGQVSNHFQKKKEQILSKLK